MNVRALFGLSFVMSFVSFGIVTKLYIWPQLNVVHAGDALLPLVVIHTFRFVGLSFLVPGVVSLSLPRAFAAPAAYGDLIAAILALIATLALSTHAPWAFAIVWIFNVWGAGDLLHAIYEGQIRLRIGPDLLGAAFFIPTVVVPPLLVTHGLIFWLLLTVSKAP
jgi:hypothetical protein